MEESRCDGNSAPLSLSELKKLYAGRLSEPGLHDVHVYSTRIKERLLREFPA